MKTKNQKHREKKSISGTIQYLLLYVFCAGVIMICITGCCPPCPDPTSQHNQALQNDTDTVPGAVSLGTIDTKNIHAHDISYETFLQLSGNAFTQFPTETGITLGGYWATSVFNFIAPTVTGTTVSGWQYYLCADYTGTALKHIFLSGRNVNDYTPGGTTFASACTTSFNTSIQQFKYAEPAPATAGTGYDKMKRFFELTTTMPAATAPTAPSCTTLTQVQTYNPKFSGWASFAGKNTNYGGFILGDDILRLKNQTVVGGGSIVGIRYFIGYDPNADTDKIKILLCAVDATGKNLLIKPGTPTTHYIILERSWPPGAN